MALPDYEHLPALPSQLAQVPLVSGNVSLTLCLPELGVGRRRYPAVSAFVHMPEAAVNEDDFAMPRQNHVRMTRQVFAMQCVTVAHTVNERADYDPRL